MTIRRIRFVVATLALVAVACGGDDSASDDTEPTDETAGGTTAPTTPTSIDRPPDELVLEVSVEGGFGSVEAMYDPLPVFALYGDGTLLGPAPAPDSFPAPLLPEVTESRLEEAEISAVLDGVAAAGLDVADDERFDELTEPVADAPHTVFTYVDESGATHRMSVLALGVDGSRPPEVDELRLLLESLEATHGGGDASTYEPDRYQVLISPAEGGEHDESAEIRPWPLPVGATDVERVGQGLGCVVVDEADAVDLAAAVADADTLTLFDDEGTVYRLTVRPLLPHEEGCPA